MFERDIRRNRENPESWNQRFQNLRRKLDQIEVNTSPLEIGQFVNRVNRLLETFVPEVFEVSQRDAFEYDEETILYYQDEGIIDRAGDGWGDFRYRHILQALLLKKLLVRGLPMRRIAFLMKEMDNSAYKRLLIGNDFLGHEYGDADQMGTNQDYQFDELSQLMQSGGASDDRDEFYFHDSMPQSQKLSESQGDQYWVRLPILPGLEIHVSNRFRRPRTESDTHSILKIIKLAIEKAGRFSDRDRY